MTTTQSAAGPIVVTGDVTMDWHIVNRQHSGDTEAVWNQADWTSASWQRGGAALLADLIEVLVADLGQKSPTQYPGPSIVLQTAAPTSPVHPDDRRFHHAYALWSRFQERGEAVWRVQEYLGLDPSPEAEAVSEWKRVVGDTSQADIVVLDDANLGFRDHPELWPSAIAADAHPSWVLVKMARPVAEGQLWDHLHEHHADRLIAVMPVNDLRRTEVHISRGLSWERTAQDIAWELVHNPRVNSLSRCAHVMISFGTAGGLLLSHTGADDERSASDCLLFFDPHVIEGMWRRAHAGHMIGYMTCLAVGIARQLILAPRKPDVHQGIQSGLTAARRLHRDGYSMSPADTGRLSFPIRAIAQALGNAVAPFAAVEVQDPVRFLRQPADGDQKHTPDGWWTILEDRHRDDLHSVAERVVLQGAEFALRDVPQGRFGHLLTVDRREIESFRSIHALAAEYLSKERRKRPLSIAVFGAPGSGKSFGITQVAQSLAPGRIEVLEFNLSQFEGPHEIADALHRVRDVTLGGMIPLVFWDEFDTSLQAKPLGWLRYFLAPMQDGAFRRGQIVHPIGRSIFVFAGGTSHRMQDFGADLSPEASRAAKVPDFISRLKGYVDILGPNPSETAAGGQRASDPYCVIRRAILVRSVLERNAPHLFEQQGEQRILRIDRGVLRAFLGINRYKHGIRSIESIVTTSRLSGKSAYERSSLPAEDQLTLHVDGQEFLSLVQQINLQGNLLDELAKAHHQVFRRRLEDDGYEWAPTTDDERRTHSSLLPWSELPEDEKEQNRAAVRDIPHKLAQVGYVMIAARSNQPPFEFPENDEDLERLAELEHRRWMHSKLEAGWRCARATDKEQKLHEALLNWDELPDDQKEKDRALVRAIPRILAQAGYTVVKGRDEDEE
ncbi:MAG: RyR domain-containing protein [Anaerolineae bacterium]